jgi:hypothetical protein
VHRLPREVLRKRDRHQTSTKFRFGVIRRVHELSNGPRINQTAYSVLFLKYCVPFVSTSVRYASSLQRSWQWVLYKSCHFTSPILLNPPLGITATRSEKFRPHWVNYPKLCTTRTQPSFTGVLAWKRVGHVTDRQTDRPPSCSPIQMRSDHLTVQHRKVLAWLFSVISVSGMKPNPGYTEDYNSYYNKTTGVKLGLSL